MTGISGLTRRKRLADLPAAHLAGQPDVGEHHIDVLTGFQKRYGSFTGTRLKDAPIRGPQMCGDASAQEPLIFGDEHNRAIGHGRAFHATRCGEDRRELEPLQSMRSEGVNRQKKR